MQTNCHPPFACNSAADHTFRKAVPVQVVDATPSELEALFTGGVYDPKKT
jgi:hypothetical protein